MRILIWLNSFLPELGGIQTLTANLIPEFLRRGHEPILVTSEGHYNVPVEESYIGIPVYRFPLHEAARRKDIARVITYRKRIEALIRDSGTEVIHFHPTGPEVLFFQEVRRRVAVPALVTIHNNLELQDFPIGPDSTHGQVIREAEWVSAVSNDALAWVLRHAPEVASRASVIENGVPPIGLEAEPLPFDPPRLLYAGRFARQKRVDLLLDAFAAVSRSHPEALLYLAGSGEEQPMLARQAQELGIAGQVTFLGLLEPDEMPALMNQSTMIVFSSDHEGLPMVALEAGQMARPIAATRAGGLVDVVTDGVTGKLVPCGDAPGLARAINCLLEDREAAGRMGRAAQEQVAKRFSIGHCVDEYERVFSRIARPV